MTNHSAVLILITQHNQMTLREMAYILGLSDQPIHGIRSRRYPSKRSKRWGNRYRGNFDMPL